MTRREEEIMVLTGATLLGRLWGEVTAADLGRMLSFTTRRARDLLISLQAQGEVVRGYHTWRGYTWWRTKPSE